MATVPQGSATKTVAVTSDTQRRWNTVNISQVERWLSGIGGGVLAAYGLLHRTWSGIALVFAGGWLAYRGISGHSYFYQALGINTARADVPPATSVPHKQGIKLERVVTIDRSPQELYQFWRNFENLPHLMNHLKEVRIKDARRSHWVARAPGYGNVEWDAEIINERENELIAWRSLQGSQISNAGSVHFRPAPGGRGTEVKVVLEYVSPAGRLGALVAKLFGGEPEQQIREDMRHFKEVMEAGEIPTNKGQSSGRRRK